MIFAKFAGFLGLFIASGFIMSVLAGWYIDPLAPYCSLEHQGSSDDPVYACYGGYGWIYLFSWIANIAMWIIGTIVMYNHEDMQRDIEKKRIEEERRYNEELLRHAESLEHRERYQR